NADEKTMKDTMTPRATAELQSQLGTKPLAESLKEDLEEMKQVKGYRILERRTNSAEEVILKWTAVPANLSPTNEIKIQKIDGVWKVDEPPLGFGRGPRTA